MRKGNKDMKKIMGLVLGVASIALIVGCQKKEAQAPVEQPMVVEQSAAAQTAMNMEAAMPAAPAMEAMTATAAAVTDTVASVVEKPTNQQIQEALKNAGLYDGKVDGSIGPKTKKAIEAFQTQNGLTADGKVGAKTWAKLGVHLGAGAAASAIATEPILPTDTSATATNTGAASN